MDDDDDNRRRLSLSYCTVYLIPRERFAYDEKTTLLLYYCKSSRTFQYLYTVKSGHIKNNKSVCSESCTVRTITLQFDHNRGYFCSFFQILFFNVTLTLRTVHFSKRRKMRMNTCGARGHQRPTINHRRPTNHDGQWTFSPSLTRKATL